MRLHIMGRDEAILAVAEERLDPSAIVSITAPGQRPPALFTSWLRCLVLHLAFDDVPFDDRDAEYRRENPGAGYDAPTRTDVERVISAPIGVIASDVIVHCAAGISRSSAIALTIRADQMRREWTNNGDWSAREFDPHRRGAAERALGALIADVDATCAAGFRNDRNIRPNPRIVWLADAILDYRGELIRAVGRAFNLPPARFYGEIREIPLVDLPFSWEA